MLGKAELTRMLREGRPGPREKIFVGDTWTEDSLRPAAYDLRIASDWLITPVGTRYWPGGPDGRERLDRPFRIEPGEVAFVSSVEHLRMPPNLAANIAVRFHSALEGLLVMGGLLVDPGYEGRLHFQLANIGGETFTVVPGRTSVAALQFFPLEGPPSKESRVNDPRKLLDGLFYEGAEDPLQPLEFFPRVAAAEEKIGEVQAMAEEQKVKVETAKRSTDQLVVFGVFLIAASLFTAGIAALIDALASNTYEKAGEVLVAPTNWGLTSVVGALAVLVAVAIASCLMMWPVFRIVRANNDG